MTMSMAERGRLGGKATAEKYGREHMSEIGKAGFEALLNRYPGIWDDTGNGDPKHRRHLAVTWLQRKRGMAKLPRSQWASGSGREEHAI